MDRKTQSAEQLLRDELGRGHPQGGRGGRARVCIDIYLQCVLFLFLGLAVV